MPGAPDGGEFMERMLGDLLGLMGNASASLSGQLELARSLAMSVATGGEPEKNVEPLARIELEELARVAELHVTELTGLPVNPTGTPVEITTVGPGSWAWHTLEDWRFLLEAMSPSGAAGGRDKGHEKGPTTAGDAGAPEEQLERGPRGDEPGLGLVDLGPSSTEPWSDSGSEGPERLVARFMSTMGPMLTAMQLGSAVGHLARTVMGQYEVPIPRAESRLLMVPRNIERFADDWSLPLDQVRIWICLRELTAHAVLTRPHVASRFKEMLVNVVRAVSDDSAGIMDRLSGLDTTDPEALQRLLGDPEALLASEPSPERIRAGADLEAATAALLGYIEHVLDQASSRILGGRTALEEAWRRRQHDRERADRAAELLFGMDLGPAQVERGVAFVHGVLERGGEEGLSMLWSSAHTLPTPSEVDAPGLWLERVRLTET